MEEDQPKSEDTNSTEDKSTENQNSSESQPETQESGDSEKAQESSETSADKGSTESSEDTSEEKSEPVDITAELDASGEDEKTSKPRKKSSYAIFSTIAREKDGESKEEKKPKDSKDLSDAKERMMEIRDQLMTMKWDVEHGQINPAKKVKYDQLKKEYEELVEKINKAE